MTLTRRSEGSVRTPMFRGLVAKFAYIALPVFLILNIGFLAGYAHYRTDAIRSELAAEIGSLAFRLSRGVATAALDNDPATASSILQTLAGNRSVRCAVIRRPDGSVLTGWPFPPCAETVTAPYDVTLPVAQAGRPVGEITILYDERWVFETFVKELGYIAAAILFASLVAFLACLVAHRMTIGRPLGRLLAAIEARRDNRQHEAITWRSRDELGTVIRVYNRMTEAERARIQQLEDTTRELRAEIEERKRIEAELRTAQVQLMQASKLEAIGTLAAGIAHEINTPLQYLATNLSFLKEGFDGYAGTLSTLREREAVTSAELDSIVEDRELGFYAEEMEHALKQGEQGISEVSRIVNAVKRFAHPGQAEKQEIDLAETIRNAIEVTKSQWKYVVDDIVCDIAPDLPRLEGYPGELSQVLLNLIVNAVNAIEDKPDRDDGSRDAIGICAAAHAGWVDITVTDTGLGIPQENLERIFDMFFTTKGPGRGSGQGLAICQSVVMKKHGGTMRVESKVGVGTNFTVRLPAAVQAEAA